MKLPKLVLVTDRAQLPEGRTLVDTVAAARDAGLTHVLLRELDLGRRDRELLARDLQQLGLTVIAAHKNIRGCVGVHLPAGDRRPRLEVWGRSCHSADEVLVAQRDGARWATLSPFAASASKPGYGPALPPEAFDGHGIPVLALGGVDAGNAREAITAGAHGVAVMGAVMRAQDPGTVVARLMGALA
jgi:thiamine-phosphate pyrophosphorylase